MIAVESLNTEVTQDCCRPWGAGGGAGREGLEAKSQDWSLAGKLEEEWPS